MQNTASMIGMVFHVITFSFQYSFLKLPLNSCTWNLIKPVNEWFIANTTCSTVLILLLVCRTKLNLFSIWYKIFFLLPSFTHGNWFHFLFSVVTTFPVPAIMEFWISFWCSVCFSILLDSISCRRLFDHLCLGMPCFFAFPFYQIHV